MGEPFRLQRLVRKDFVEALICFRDVVHGLRGCAQIFKRFAAAADPILSIRVEAFEPRQLVSKWVKFVDDFFPAQSFAVFCDSVETRMLRSMREPLSP